MRDKQQHVIAVRASISLWLASIKT